MTINSPRASTLPLQWELCRVWGLDAFLARKNPKTQNGILLMIKKFTHPSYSESAVIVRISKLDNIFLVYFTRTRFIIRIDALDGRWLSGKHRSSKFSSRANVYLQPHMLAGLWTTKTLAVCCNYKAVTAVNNKILSVWSFITFPEDANFQNVYCPTKNTHFFSSKKSNCRSLSTKTCLLLSYYDALSYQLTFSQTDITFNLSLSHLNEFPRLNVS